MSRFILKLVVFSIFPILTLYGVFLLENGTADPYYRKFTAPQQSSLIIGTSKSAEGINPKILNNKLNKIFQNDIFNYSFTIHDSPFGLVYLNSIKKKLKKSSKSNYFIISVDPWSISRRNIDSRRKSLFEEDQRFLGKMNFVNLSPNLLYLFKYYEKSFYDIITYRFYKTNRKLEGNGFLIRETKNDSLLDLSHLNKMKITYKEFSHEYFHSLEREKALIETIKFLKKNGSVFLIRMPVHDNIFEIEECFYDNFNKKMCLIAKDNGVLFKDFNFLNEELRFKDGVHLDSASASTLTEKISEWIYEKSLN